MMSFKKLLALIAAAALLLAGCAAPEETPTQTNEPIPQYTLPPVEKEEVPIQGGALSFPIPENPGTLNPLKAKNVELHNLLSLIYEKPIRIGTAGKPEAELAETWDVDSSGTVWTFNLRKGVNWQQGFGEFTSKDVIYTIDTIMSYTPDISPYARYNSQISSYIALDPYTVSVTLAEPGNIAVYFMTFPVLCKAYCETGDIDLLTPVGSGPYIMASYEPGEQMILQASDWWWRRPPYIQQLTAKCFPDNDYELNAFERNLLDFLTTSILTVETYQKYGKSIALDYATQYYDCLVPNTSGLFSDINLRLALGYALDKREIISKALLGHAVATDYPVPLDSYLSGGTTNIYEYNLQKAIELLAESEWIERDGDGVFEKVVGTEIIDLTLELMIPENENDTYRLDVAENIAAQLQSCGMQVEVVEEPYAAYMRKLQNGTFDLALCSFYLDSNPDVSFMLETGAPSNYGGFSDPEMDALLAACRIAMDDEQMIQAYAALEDRIVLQAPQIGLYFRSNTLLFDASVTISENIRDLNIYNTIPDWYMFTQHAEVSS